MLFPQVKFFELNSEKASGRTGELQGLVPVSPVPISSGPFFQHIWAGKE
jgi:hypothetical protein